MTISKGLPDEIADYRVDTDEHGYSTIRAMILEETPDPVVECEYLFDEDEELISFVAWTENHVLTLLFSPYGCNIIKQRRNPE